jgi:hypothetical protein
MECARVSASLFRVFYADDGCQLAEPAGTQVDHFSFFTLCDILNSPRGKHESIRIA